MTSQFPHYSEYTPAGGQPGHQSMHPSLGLAVTPDQRDRAERFLAEAYADGRLNELEFDSRMDQVLGAQTRKDLNQAFYGLVDVAPSSQALGLHPAYRPSLVNQNADGRTGRGVAALAHFSVFFVWIFGPLITYLMSSPRSYARRESAKAFNFQVVSTVGFIGGSVLTGILGIDGWLMGLLAVAWLVLTLTGGFKAAQGKDWRNPVRKVVKWELLDEN
jgi:uncharacterized Tic20 family protein